jgi:hypothetical protein
VVPTLEVPHFSEHKSHAIGTQTPSHLLCQEKTHRDAYWKSVGPSGSFSCPSHKKNKSPSFSASLDSLARSHLLLTDKTCRTVNIITRKRADTIILSLLLSFRVIPLLPSFTRRANTQVMHSNSKWQ